MPWTSLTDPPPLAGRLGNNNARFKRNLTRSSGIKRVGEIDHLDQAHAVAR
jgi:hypothetical protein